MGNALNQCLAFLRCRGSHKRAEIKNGTRIFFIQNGSKIGGQKNGIKFRRLYGKVCLDIIDISDF